MNFNGTVRVIRLLVPLVTVGCICQMLCQCFQSIEMVPKIYNIKNVSIVTKLYNVDCIFML